MLINNTAYKDQYSPNGSQVAFPITFPFFDSSQVKVYYSEEGYEEATLVDSTLYTITGAGSESGGTLTFTTAPEAGITIAILRDMPITQTYEYTELDNFPAESHENALAKLTMICQEIKEEIGRSIKVPATSTDPADDYVSQIFEASAAAQASKIEAASSASAASTSEANTATSASNAASSAITAQTWAESETPPDPNDTESKSAKTWALIAGDSVPIATETLAGKAKTSASWQVDPETGVATVPSATESLAGIVERATNAEASAGTDTTRFVTPYHLKTYAPNPSSATTTTEGLMRFATDEEASDASEVDAAVKPHQVEIIAQAASNAIPSDMTILSTGVGIYRHSSGAGSVIVFGGKQVLVADASYRIGSKTRDAAVSWCAGKTIDGLRCYMPDLDTLRVIWLNRTSIDSYDPTASSNTTKKLSNWGFGSSEAYVWSRLPHLRSTYDSAWFLGSDGGARNYNVSSTYGALPCIEL